MPLTRPTLQEIINRVESDAEALLTGRVALLQRAVIRIFARIIAGASHIAYGFISKVADILMVDTATGTTLDRHSYIWGVSRKAATFANGPVVFTGVEGTSIPGGTDVQDSVGNEYTTTADGVIISGIASVAVQAKNPGASANITDSRQLTLIAPIDDIDSVCYAGQWTVPYDNLAGGTFGVGDTLTNTTQSGSAIVVVDNGADEARVVIVSGEFEDNDSFNNGSGVSADVDGIPVLYAGIVGGQDEEADNDLRERILLRIQEAPAGGTVADFERWAREVATENGSVSGAWAYPATPSPGWVTVVCKTAGDDPVPTAGLITDVEDYLDERRPVTCDVVVEPVVKVETTFAISISPNNSTIQAAITESLQDMFEAESAPGEDMLISRIRNAISVTGVSDYEITGITLNPGGAQPIDNISVSGFDYLTLDTINYSTL